MAPQMTESNGIRAKVEHQGQEIGRLWTEKASAESVQNLQRDVRDLRADMKDEVGGLRKTLLVVAGAWLFGTLMFLIAALEFVQ